MNDISKACNVGTHHQKWFVEFLVCMRQWENEWITINVCPLFDSFEIRSTKQPNRITCSFSKSRKSNDTAFKNNLILKQNQKIFFRSNLIRCKIIQYFMNFFRWHFWNIFSFRTYSNHSFDKWKIFHFKLKPN